MIELKVTKELLGAEGKMELDVDLKILNKSFVALLGENGSGKTTLLRIIAGLEQVKSGTIKVGDEIWLDGKFSLPPQKRDIGFVFQDYALFANMSVEKNLLFVKKDKELAKKLLDITGLSELKDRLPTNLSGGQKQRVSLCRALMNRPKLLLLDEPLSALDLSMRSKLQNEILSLHKEFGTTTIMVSHDPNEIYRLSERTLVLHHGKIINDDNTKKVLLKNQKSTLEGKIIDIIKTNTTYTAIVNIGEQLIEMDLNKAINYKTGDI